MKLRTVKFQMRSAAEAVRYSRRGFTIIEIALCLGIIAFALVAIIGVLPFGMRVQQQNREETLINQDATVWMDAIRSGAQGYDDLTNHVDYITNTVWKYVVQNGTIALAPSPNPDIYVYSPTINTLNGNAVNPTFLLTNGAHIVGLLSTPKIKWTSDTSFSSNIVVALVRAMSGAEVDKAPQTNQAILSDAFSYKLITENIDYVPFDTNTVDFSQTNNWTLAATNNARVIRTMQTNSHDLRVTFRWPILPNGDIGNGRQTFRLFSGSPLMETNDPFVPAQQIYFFRPSTFVQVTNY